LIIDFHNLIWVSTQFIYIEGWLGGLLHALASVHGNIMLSVVVLFGCSHFLSRKNLWTAAVKTGLLCVRFG